MKRTNLKIILIFFIFFSTAKIFSQGLDFGFQIGLSTPNDKIADVYNKNKITMNDSTNQIGNFISDGMDVGYHLAVKGRIGLSDNADFILGFGIHRFPQTTIEVKDPTNNELLATLGSNTNIVPITAGMNVYLIRSFVGLYASGDLTYNYISSTLEYIDDKTKVSVPLTKTPSDSRLGFGLGAGVDFSLGLIMLNVEAKYNYLNLIGKEESEGNKSYLSLGVGVYF